VNPGTAQYESVTMRIFLKSENQIKGVKIFAQMLTAIVQVDHKVSAHIRSCYSRRPWIMCRLQPNG